MVLSPARDDEGVQAFQVFGEAHLAGGYVQVLEQGDMLSKIALNGNHAHGEQGF